MKPSTVSLHLKNTEKAESKALTFKIPETSSGWIPASHKTFTISPVDTLALGEVETVSLSAQACHSLYNSPQYHRISAQAETYSCVKIKLEYRYFAIALNINQ